MGSKPGFNRDHLLFYSAPDDDFFVAIQDRLTGTVVTVLPLDYHSNLAWDVSPEDCDIAKNIYVMASIEGAHKKSTSNATLFIISGHFLDDEGNQKTKVIIKIDSSQYDNRIINFLSDKDFFFNLNGLFSEKGINPERVFGFTIRLGNRGEPITIDLKEASIPGLN